MANAKGTAPRARHTGMTIIVAMVTHTAAIRAMPTERRLLCMHRKNHQGSACSCHSSSDRKISDSQPVADTRNLSKGNNMIRVIALFLIASTALLASCNTVAGAGDDISKGGQAVHNTAEDAK